MHAERPFASATNTCRRRALKSYVSCLIPILHSCQLQRFFETTLELLVGNLGYGAQVRRDATRAARAFLLVRNHMVKFPIDVLVMDAKWLAITTRRQQFIQPSHSSPPHNSRAKQQKK